MIYGLNVAYKKHTASRLHKAGHQYITVKREKNTPAQRMQDLQTAEANLNGSLSYDQSEGETFYWLGYTYFNMPGKQKEALEYFHKGLEYSNNKLLHLHTGIIYLNSGKFAEAEKHFEKVRYSDPENPFTYYYMAHIYKNQNNVAGLKEMLKHALILGNVKSSAVIGFYVNEAIRTKDPELMNGLYETVNFSHLGIDMLKFVFNSFIEKMSENRQEELVKVCIERFGIKDIFVVINFAVEKDMDDIAFSKLQDIIDDKPNLAVSYLHLSRIYKKQGNNEKAQEQLEKYERLK
jgi:Tfp pilus assembly protein PilF